MFASARSAAAAPLASPSLKHVLEFTHTHAHTHGPLVGLGIRVSPAVPSSSTLAGSASSNALHTLHYNLSSSSGQPVTGRPPIQRMQSSASTFVPPRAPRLQASATLPQVFSPLLLTPMGNYSPLSEGYFSDANGLLENNMEAIVSGGQSMINHATQGRRFTAANDARSTLNSTLHINEVERIGLGISGLSLNALAHNRMIAAPVLTDEDDSESERSMPVRNNRRRMASRSRRVAFYMRPYIIGRSNRSIDDGYNADAESDHVDVILRPCMGRVSTPYYAPNGEGSWL